MRIQTEFVGFRAKQQHQRKLESLARDTGLTVSDVLRHLVENADVKPVTTKTVQVKPLTISRRTPALQRP